MWWMDIKTSCSFECDVSWCAAKMRFVFGLLALFVVQTVWGQLIGYTPDVDYPIYNEVPRGLSFNCDGRIPGYYSDPEARCQVWHWCANGKQYSFLCPNGTLFNQYTRVCDWFFNVDCPSAPNFYNVNEDLYIIPNNRI